jgi:hypothetical protein
VPKTANQRIRKGARARGAPAYTTGGGGFGFEDQVGAWLAAALVAGDSPLGTGIAVPVEIRFQTGELGGGLDDVLVLGSAGGGPRWRASVKSFDFLRGSSLAPDFVAAAWRTVLAEGFGTCDRIGFIAGASAEGNWRALERLITAARTDDNASLERRITMPRAFNQAQRDLWESARCPAHLAPADTSREGLAPARLLRALLPLRLDFASPTSQAEAEGLARCRRALVPEDADRATDLWNALCRLVAEFRPTGGALTWPVIAERIGAHFRWRRPSDLAPDWELLDRHTADACAAVRDRLGADLRLPREEARAALDAQAADTPVIYLTGPSGCGKTALAKEWVGADGFDALWLSGADLERGLQGVNHGLRLSRPVTAVLAAARKPVRVVVDGLDRAHAPAPFDATAALARLAAQSRGRAQVVVTCQQMELARVTAKVREANAPGGYEFVSIGDLDDADVSLALTAEPALAELAVAGQLRGVLRRPKLLDLVLDALLSASPELAGGLRDEAAVAELWWEQQALAGANAAERSEFLIGLAERQADELRDEIPAGDLGPLGAYVRSADGLRRDGILEGTPDRYAFGHDLFGDWSRMRRLRLLADDALAFVAAKADLPTWHRAIRLHALGVLREEGLVVWSAQRERLEEQSPIVADLYLDAVLFADDAAQLLRELWPTLIANRGSLLRRLLVRFLHVATVPDPRGALLLGDRASELETHWAALARVPLWPLWLPVLGQLHAERAAAIEAAPYLTARVADSWLRYSGERWPARDQAGEIAIDVGTFVVERRLDGWHFDRDEEKRLWRAVVAAGGVFPDRVLDLCLPGLQPEPEARATDDHELFLDDWDLD